MTGASKLVDIELMDKEQLLRFVEGERSKKDAAGAIFKVVMLSPQTKILHQGYNWELSGSPEWDSSDLPLSLLRSYAHVLVSS